MSKKFELGYDYASSGNLTGKSVYDPDTGSVDDRWSYAYSNHAATAISTTKAGARFVMRYDAVGNLVSQDDHGKNLGKDMAYDSYNRIRQVTDSGTGTIKGQYYYDDQGFRVRKVSRQEVDGKDRDVELLYPSMFYCVEVVRNKGGQVMQNSGYGVNNIYLNGVRVAVALPNLQARYYLTDQVDSVKVVVDDSGQIQSRMEYLPFGETWFQEDRAGEEGKNTPKYNSQELDKESGYYFYNARHYDPEIARFVTPDTVVPDQFSTQSWNRFSYCRNNPIIYKDPTGHYERDVHYNLTEYLAKRAGFSEKHAKEISTWNQRVDTDKETEPFKDKQVRKEWHFPVDKMGDSVERNSPAGRRKAEAAINDKKSVDFKDFGRGLHVFQDSYGHEGYGAKVGHATGRHDPDRTYLDKRKAMEMAHETYKLMQDYLKERGYKVKDEWKKIEGDVAKKMDEYSRKYNEYDDRKKNDKK